MAAGSRRPWSVPTRPPTSPCCRYRPGNLQQIPFGQSTSPRVGDLVLAIGSPFGLGQSVTWGIVSALGRTLDMDAFEDFIQTDAAINPGNSGGALIDMEGRLIGISTAIIGTSGGNIGIGFAVPIDMAVAVMDQLIQFGSMQRGRIGMDIIALDPDTVASMGGLNGAAVYRVEADSPAARAGLKVGDVIFRFNGQALRDARDLVNRFGLARLGDHVMLSVQRGSSRHEIELRLDEPRAVATRQGG